MLQELDRCLANQRLESSAVIHGFFVQRPLSFVTWLNVDRIMDDAQFGGGKEESKKGPTKEAAASGKPALPTKGASTLALITYFAVHLTYVAVLPTRNLGEAFDMGW